MQTIKARTLLKYSTDELWTLLTGDFNLCFDDGTVVLTNAKESIYTSYAWTFHREYPDTPLLPTHHLRGVLDKSRLGSGTHLALLGVCMWAVYDQYSSNSYKLSEIDFRDVLAKKIYSITNTMYVDLSYRLGDYVTSLDIMDFIEALNHPAIKQANDSLVQLPTIPETQKAIDNVYAVINRTLLSGTELINNPLSLAARSKLASLEQVNQCLGPRGYLTDTDSNLFTTPVLRGYAQGLRLFYDSIVESRSAAKSLIFSKTPLQQAEYFSRRLQLMSQIVRNLHSGDCKTTEHLPWRVRGPEYDNGELVQKGDLYYLLGKRYLDDDGLLKTIQRGDSHLVGRKLQLRSVLHCAHPDPYGICTTCFGELSLSVPAETNIGQMCCTSLAQQSSQNVLSVKHHDGSSKVEGIGITQHNLQYLKKHSDNNSYLLADDLKGKSVYLIIPADRAQNITDIMDTKVIENLNITSVSKLSSIGLKILDRKGAELPLIDLVVSKDRRMASMTYPMLHYIRSKGWDIDARNNYVIDMSDWDFTKPFLTLPLQHVNMSDHSASISSLLESSVDMLVERDTVASPNAVILELYDLVNSKLNVNLAVLEVVLYGIMVVSAAKGNYSLPKPGGEAGLGVMKLTMANRSASVLMAYEGHQEFLTSPSSYTNTNRTDHILDAILLPGEVAKIQGYGYRY